MSTLTIAGLLAEGIDWIVWLLATGYLFVLPGWGILALFWAGWDERDWMEKLGLASGTSLAFHALFVVWMNAMGLQLGGLNAWLPGLMGVLCLIVGLRRTKFSVQNVMTWESAVSLIVIGMVFGARFWAIRTLVAPSWGDSVHHSFLAQLFLDHGGLFQSWLPYTPYESFSTHFGFSYHVALFSWFTQIDAVEATVIVGQVINGIAVLGLYPLAKWLGGNHRWTGIGALILIGLFSPMPGYYLNWGRYAQLAGQAVLPTALWMLVKSLEEDKLIKGLNGPSLTKLLISGMVLGGMVLNYFRMPLYYAAFVPGWLLIVGLTKWKWDWKKWGRVILQLIVIGSVGIVLFLPWAMVVVQNAVGELVGEGVATAYTWQDVRAEYQVFRQWRMFVPPGLAVLSGLGLLWGLIRRNGKVVAVGFWAILLSSLVAARMIRLPGAALMQNFAVLIALYIPLGVMGGWLVGEVIQKLLGLGGRWCVAFISVVIIIVSGWGAFEQRKMMDPSFIMVRPQDRAAMDWIKQNTPSNAIFLVEGYLIFNGTSAVGADAGWWIPLLAGRSNTMPPQYALLAEKPVEPGYSQQVVNLVAQIHSAGLAAPETTELFCEWGITHAYIGQGQGLVGFGAVQLFGEKDLENTSFMQVYSQDQVSIYELDRTVCRDEP